MKNLLILLLIVSPLMGQEKKGRPVVNNSLKLYGMFGLPIGLGLTYTGEFRSSADSSLINALSLDAQTTFISQSPTIASLGQVGGNFGIQYSIGNILNNGSRFYIDIVGLGINLLPRDELPRYYSIKLLGFQQTLNNGFYWGVRTEITFAVDAIVSSSIKVVNMELVTSHQRETRTDFTGYLAIGYDFGKNINPKDYKSRIR